MEEITQLGAQWRYLADLLVLNDSAKWKLADQRMHVTAPPIGVEFSPRHLTPGLERNTLLLEESRVRPDSGSRGFVGRKNV